MELEFHWRIEPEATFVTALIDLLKFQVSSYSALDKIDVGVYVATTAGFQRSMKTEFKQNWKGSLTFEKIVRYLPHFKSVIQVPICVMGIDA
jgi:hypothetical protein